MVKCWITHKISQGLTLEYTSSDSAFDFRKKVSIALKEEKA